MTYLEKSSQLAVESSIAVMALSNPEYTDLEFLPLKPRQLPEKDHAALKARWPGRGLRSVGVIGLVGAAPRCAFSMPLGPEQVSARVGAFLAYLHALFCDSLAEQQKGDEAAWLEALYSLEDDRTEA